VLIKELAQALLPCEQVNGLAHTARKPQEQSVWCVPGFSAGVGNQTALNTRQATNSDYLQPQPGLLDPALTVARASCLATELK